jgi:hypothetical protein
VRHKTPKEAHATHSARSALDPSRANLPPTSLGNPYPRDDVVAMIDDRESAERAVRALRDAGLPEDDVDLLDGPSVVEANRSFRQRRGRLQRLEAWLSSLFSDEAAYATAYVLEGERGHYLVIAHAAQPEVVERISQVLRAHGARDMRHYELLTVTDL